MTPPLASLGIRRLHLASSAVPVEHTAAHELALLTGAQIAVVPRPSGPGVAVALCIQAQKILEAWREAVTSEVRAP